MKSLAFAVRFLAIAVMFVTSRPTCAGDTGALVTDGVDDYAATPSSASLSLAPAMDGDAFTIEATFYVDAVARNSTETLIHKPESYGLEVEFRTLGAPLVRLRVWANPTTGGEVSVAREMDPGLHHLAAVVTRTPGLTTAYLYLDGFLARTATILAPADSVHPLTVGGGAGKFFKGFIGSIRVSDTARYSGDAYSIRESPFVPDGNTRALWQFDEPPGATVFQDGSGHGNHLQGFGGTATGLMPEDLRAGALDRTFNPGTGARSNIFPNGVYAMARQPDGKLIIGGQFMNYDGVTRTNLARLNPDGALDPDFNPVIVSGFGTGEVNGVAVQADGRILVGGEFSKVNGVARNHIARLLPDGSLDAAFNPVFVFNSGINTLELLPDGKILLAGQLEMGTFPPDRRGDVVRIHSDGTLDLSFDSVDIFGFVFHLLRQPDGQLLVSGSFSKVAGADRTGFARLSPNGALDTSFAPALFRDAAAAGPDSMALECDGQIVIAGRFNTVNGIARNGAARLNGDGTLDEAFVIGRGPPGTFSAGGHLDWTTVLPDGNLLFNGVFTPSTGIGETFLAKFLPDGTLDPQYKPVAFHFPNDTVHAHLLQDDGRLLIGGEFSDVGGIRRNGMARLLSGPGLLPRFTTVALQQDGQLRLVLAGVPGCHYLLESSPALNVWTPQLRREMPATGLIEWIIPRPPGFGAYYFRARHQ